MASTGLQHPREARPVSGLYGACRCHGRVLGARYEVPGLVWLPVICSLTSLKPVDAARKTYQHRSGPDPTLIGIGCLLVLLAGDWNGPTPWEQPPE